MQDQLTPAYLAQRLTATLDEVKGVITRTSPVDLAKKPLPNKWSKKEILGHLIDSGINNLQRFTEIRYSPQPYTIRRYNQDELVKVNAYQQASIEEILSCWLAINTRILNVIKALPPGSLSLGIVLPDGNQATLGFLINDYVDHMIHHNEQLKRP